MKVYFYLDHPNSGHKEYPIYLRWTHKGTSIETSMGYKISKAAWDLRRQRVRGGRFNGAEVSAEQINEYLNHIEDAITGFHSKLDPGEKVSANEMRAFLSSINIKQIKVSDRIIDDFQHFLDYGVTVRRWAESTYRKHKTLYYHLLAFNPDLRYKDVTSKILDSYIIFLGSNLKMMDVSVRKDFKLLKELLSWAERNGKNPSPDYKTYTFKYKLTKRAVVYLTEDEFRKLSTFPIPENGKELILTSGNGEQYVHTVTERGGMERARDYFVILTLTGLRFSDMMNIKNMDISGGVLHLTTQKTDDALTIPLSREVLDLLAKYHWSDDPKEKVLPSLSNQRMNEYLKQLGRICGFNRYLTFINYVAGKRHDEVKELWEVLSTHSGRRSFICQLLAKGYSAENIMSVTGHKGYEAMKPYIAINEENKRRMMEALSSSVKNRERKNQTQ